MRHSTKTQPDQVSVVVTAFNASNFIATTLDSVLDQSFAPHEIVIVDDGSTDDTRAIIEGFQRRNSQISVIAQENQGVAQARNRGYRNVGGESGFILFLDHDDVLETDAVASLRNDLMQNSDASVSYGLARYIDASGNAIKHGELEHAQRSRSAIVDRRLVSWPIDRASTINVVALWSYITTPGQALIRRSALGTADVFDQSVAPADDWDLWLRLASVGDIRLVDRVVLNYRIHSSNVSNNEILMEEACIRARRKFLAESNEDDVKQLVLECHHYAERERFRKYRALTKKAILAGRWTDALKYMKRAGSAIVNSRRASI